MELELQVALVTAGGMILAALVGVVGVTTVLKLRANLKWLCMEVENYHAQEGHLVRDILERDGREPDEDLVKSKRGELRSRYSAIPEDKPTMAPGRVQKIRRSALIF